jgi:hypothetical protein
LSRFSHTHNRHDTKTFHEHEASETVEGCEIKKEPEEVMEQDTSLQNSDHEMETTEDENNGNIQVENAGSNKYSVKVVTKPVLQRWSFNSRYYPTILPVNTNL